MPVDRGYAVGVGRPVARFMTDRLLLLADDLTGGLDAAVQFSRAGVSVLVTAENPVAITGSGPGVVATDLESRHLAPAQAAARVEECVRAAARAGIRRFYKKTDSTLRGNVGAELGCLIRATGFPGAVLRPRAPGCGPDHARRHPVRRRTAARPVAVCARRCGPGPRGVG